MQHGSDTVIGPSVKLIVMDCFETLVQLGPEGYRPRLGIQRFLDVFAVDRRVPVVVISDAPEAAVIGALRQAGLLGRVSGIFDRRAAEVLPGGRSRKRIDLPIAERGLASHQAVFIGDSQLDGEAALHHGVPFIRVPRSEDRSFSFERLISGPSRYRSGEFVEHLENEYGSP